MVENKSLRAVPVGKSLLVLSLLMLEDFFYLHKIMHLFN